jgi:arginine decarboxylase
MFWHLVTRIARLVEDMDPVPEELEDLQGTLVDFYYGNFSLFQSLPDSWAISQLFPVMPIHRLTERPMRRAVLADITCDCDGKMDRFINLRDSRQGLPVHALREDEDYFLGVFLVGAYQETLGDLHNLLGDTNVVSISWEDGRIRYTHEIEGDSVADVLTYVEYDPKELTARFRQFAEQAVAEGRITPQERRRILMAYEDGLRGYTYYEHPAVGGEPTARSK